MREVRDPSLPIDHDAFVSADPPTGRVIVIAPTRAACETIEIALGLHIDTFLERTRGDEIRALAREKTPFGIVAGTGTGKTLAIRPIAEELLGTERLKVGVVNREREATPETPSWNVIIVTTGIARRWFQDGDILPQDTLIVDEIHQTSAELELCLALGKRVGCRFIWLSATVDPAFYSGYLGSRAVLEVFAFDPARAATVRVVNRKPAAFLDERFLGPVVKQKRGVGMFLPTRAGVEEAAAIVGDTYRRIHAAYYHGGEPIRVIRAFLEGEPPRPYFLAMTAAGQSALNVRGLDTVVIDDVRFANVIEGGRNVLTRLHLGANEILQMGGRVHGRVEGGRVFILSDRTIDFFSLKPTAPEFQLAGDSERVALTCADLGVRADELDLPMPLDRQSYRAALDLLTSRGIVEHGWLTKYGKAVEALPVDRPWAELIVNGEDDLLPYLAVMSTIESLHRMTRDDRNLDGLVIEGSDHLTAYNLYAEAYARCGYMGTVYGLPRHLFDEEGIADWAERRGVLVKSIEDTALAMASVYRAVGMPLPEALRLADGGILRRYQDLLARFMPFDLVIDEETKDGEKATVSRTSVCGSWGAIAGTLRYFADRFGIPRASIEGTQVPAAMLRRYARRGEPLLTYDADRRHAPLAITRRVEYYGFELERETERVDDFPVEAMGQARRALAEALASQAARHHAVKRNRAAIDEVRELWRRSGGTTKKLGQGALADLYERMLDGVTSMDEFRERPLVLDLTGWVDEDERERLAALPDAVEIRGRTVPIDYDVEEVDAGGAAEPSPYADGQPELPRPRLLTGIARLRLPEKLARTMAEEELPALDRPLRFVVLRGQRGAVRASTLHELQDLLDRPWSPEEIVEERPPRRHDAKRGRGRHDAPSPKRGRKKKGAPGDHRRRRRA